MNTLIILPYALLSYAIGMGALCYLMLFLQNLWLPKTIDSGSSADLAFGLTVNLTMLVIYLTVHSVMARPWFKAWWTRIVPPALERSTYILISGTTLFLLIALWQPLTGTIWRVDHNVSAALIYGLYAIGWGLMVSATFHIDHFSFFGLRQAWTWALKKAPRPTVFTARYLYGVTRHPISLGWLIVFWATPQMSVGHVLMALVCSSYIFIVTPIEEADLIRELGETYREYRKQVPAFLPFRR
ncbi:isoprenylcysteine carboxylmethyltransferase family protein [Marinobacter panjinensis]|uniref:Isoprenylcysteine carboxylmethyltransferase family protein n=1 Tax=Marinobacter panjinensis TaxID=2576384 RepID=A0A4U6R2W4_9GAMM|nr:isoprenylcysteine carboxylmethyltransferase family protein [Marinobacter panjinensis]MCR8915419.1 isoprenylcysteine carboxylmethyltransferase family protein [Marinobacter panjinensis]TKV66676.1 isoprenylcysteine carboxylmethyltransferase family protein [Marinobacter panjinensis]